MSSSSDSDSSDSEPDIPLDDYYKDQDQERIVATHESNPLVPQDSSNQGIVPTTSQDLEQRTIPQFLENIIKEPVNHEIQKTVSINGDGANVHIGPKFIFNPSQPGQEPIVIDLPASQRPSSVPSEHKQKLEEVAEGLRMYYPLHLIVPPPLPWFQISSREESCVEFVIKCISGARDISLTKEFTFKEVFKRSANAKQLSPVRHRILVEGHPGYGKTTLARNIAVDWGMKADYVKEFKLVIFICCRDLQGRSLKHFVSETYPSVSETNSARPNLTDWNYRESEILFILDGLDECKEADCEEINKLLQGNIYTGASILATTRPLTNDTMINYGQFTTKVCIKGFNRVQIERIIDEHFKNRQGVGERMKEKLFSGNQAYQQLVSCPLLCQLFCFLFEEDKKFPEKVTEVYEELIHQLIR